MSLRAFHIFFIVVSIALAVWFGFWEIQNSRRIGFLPARAVAAASLAAGAGLAVYLFWFVKKTKGLR